MQRSPVIAQVIATQSAITATSLDTFQLQNTDYDAVLFELSVSQVAATTTALDVHVQTLDQAGNYLDVVHFKQFTASSTTKEYALVALVSTAVGSGYIGGVTASGLSAGRVGVPLLGPVGRVAGVMSSTDAVSFVVTAYLLQQSGRT